MTDPTTQSPPVNIRNQSAPNLENKFFFGYRSYLTSNESIWVTTYSDRFTLTNMTGSLPDDVVAANDNVNSTTAPKRMISCGAKAGRACDQKVLESLGLGPATGDSASATSATAPAPTTMPVPGSTSAGGSTSSTKINGGVIAGIVVGVLAAVSIAIAAVVFFRMWAKKRKMSRGEIIGNDVSQAGQEPAAFHKKNRVQDMDRPVELEENRTYEMSADHHHLVEMPENS
ncbi:hypothetical protein NHQ30_000493 [Ciborinia camelliae]|nr:hypothetical protein NHQ30_000493 [Ciborinia camelliae]